MAYNNLPGERIFNKRDKVKTTIKGTISHKYKYDHSSRGDILIKLISSYYIKDYIYPCNVTYPCCGSP